MVAEMVETNPSDLEIWGGLSWRKKPRALGAAMIHDNLLKHLSGDTLKSLKRSWTTSGPIVISLPNGEQHLRSLFPNKYYTNSLSYKPITLTNYLCNVMENG